MKISPFLLLAAATCDQRLWYSRHVDRLLQDTLAFAAPHRVRSMNEVVSARSAGVRGAYERMMSGKARFRVVLEM